MDLVILDEEEVCVGLLYVLLIVCEKVLFYSRNGFL